MTYDDILDSNEPIIVSRSQALTELHKHGIDDIAAFLVEVGDKTTYTAQEVLDWLGY